MERGRIEEVVFRQLRAIVSKILSTDKIQFCKNTVVSEAAENRGDLLNAIHSSRGMEHVNRSHHRTFTLNIFRMNAQELIEITRRVNDPDEGLRLMSQNNREAGQQTHREVTRRVHNFVAASLTLVEHTRIFMREHYSNTPILDQYQAKVDAEFANKPLVRFVQDLRNFMLHNGLPQSEMFLNFQSNPDPPSGGGVLTTGIHIRAAQLLTWKGWSVPARTFIESSGDFVDIRTFAEAYIDNIVSFHDWLQGELDQFHSADLDKLRALQTSMNELGVPATSPPPSAAGMTEASQKSVDEPGQEFAFASDRAAALDAAATELLKKVREIDLLDSPLSALSGQRLPTKISSRHPSFGAMTWRAVACSSSFTRTGVCSGSTKKFSPKYRP
jgi:hypothetical protein